MRHKFRRLAALLPVICLAMAFMCLNAIVARAETTTVSVTLVAGDTYTITDDSGNYESSYTGEGLDTGIATVEVDGKTVTSSTTAYFGTLATSASSGSTYYVGDGTNYLVLNGSTLSTTTDITEATAFTWTVSTFFTTTRYLTSGSYYLYYNNGSWSASTSIFNRTSFASYSGDLTTNNGSSTNYALYTRTEETVTEVVSASTEITFTGVAAGTTSVTVGDTTYEITVVAVSSLATGDPFIGNTGEGDGYAVTKLTISKTLSYDLDLSEDVLVESGASVVWSSANTSIATVDQDGTVTGVSAGETTITATITYSDGSTNTYTIPVVVRDDGVDYDGSELKIYDFYVVEKTDTTAYYGILYGTTTANVTAYDLVEIQEGEAIYIAFEKTSGTAVDFFASPYDGYAVTYMASTNTMGHYLALDSDKPASTTFITTSGAAGANQVTAFGSTVVCELVQKALDLHCDSAMGWTRGSGNTGNAESLISFRSQPLPKIEKEITSVNGMAYTDGMSIEVDDVITYTITVTQYDTGDDSITYSDEILTEGLDGAVFTDTNSKTTTPTLTDGVISEDTVTTYTVTYKVTTDDLGTILKNTVSLSFTYKTNFSTGSYTDAAETSCSVAIVNFYPTSIVMDYGLPLVIDYNGHNGYNDLAEDIPVDCDYGTITVEDNVVTFIPDTVITEAFTVTLTDVKGITYTFKIYPATTVYYEEGFADYGSGWSVDTASADTYWRTYSNTGALASAQQVHAANDTSTNASYYNYGYDVAYKDDTKGSEGTAAKTTTAGASLSFTFTGTGVDIFANCDSGSGMVAIRVAGSDGTVYKLLFVDMANNGAYAVSGTAYNTPIASVSGLAHGSYTVTIYLVTINSSGFQFDGFRVYDTIAQSEDASTDAYAIQTTVYETDDEDYPEYYELRDYILAGMEVTNSTSKAYASDIAASTRAQVYASGTSNTSGAIVYYDKSSETSAMKEKTDTEDERTDLQILLDDGPKNEMYLSPGMTVVFKITTNRKVEIGLRSVTGESVSYTITAVSSNTSSTAKITTGTAAISSTVDMFYTLQTGADGDETVTYTITVPNTSSGVLSVTGIKVSDCADDTIFGELTEEDLTEALISIGYAEDEEETSADASLTDETEAEASDGSADTETETETADSADAESETEAADSTDTDTETETTDSADTETETETTGSADAESEAEGTSARAASLEVNLSDYTGSVIATTTLAKNGAAGEKTTFSVSDILAAANAVLPDGYALVSADDIADRTAVYGESSSLNLQIGRIATLTVTCVKPGTSTVATVTLTKVQTGPGKTAVFTASEIRAAIPEEYQVLLVTSVSVNYGSGENTVVTVY